MNGIAFKNLIASVSGTVKVYPDFIPEKNSLPAIQYTHIAEGSSRVLSGNKSGVWNTWRVIAVGNNNAERTALFESLQALDNSKNEDFSNVFIIAQSNLPYTPEDKTRSLFVDIKTYG